MIFSVFSLEQFQTMKTVELLQQAITNEKTLGDVMASFAKLPANRQAALSLIISDMEVRQMIDTYSKTGDSK